MKKYLLWTLLICVSLLTLRDFFKTPNLSLGTGEKTDYILVEKQKRRMSLYKKGVLIRQYRISLGSSPIGAKEKEGDGKTPEGIYHIAGKNPKSSYHLSLRVSYPSKDDIIFAQSSNLNPGGDIMIHGIRNGLGWIGKYHQLIDWTRGCIAVCNDEIEEIYSMTTEGTIVEIKP